MRHSRFSIPLLLLSLTPAPALPAHAEDTPTPFSNPAADAAAERNQRQIMQTLRLLEKKYGSDAVLLQGHALAAAVRSGAILEAEANFPGHEERDGRRYLELRLTSGIVFNDNEHSARQRPMRVWTNIVEPSLRRLEQLSIDADGMLVHVLYSHKPYKDEFDLRDSLKQAPPSAEAARFYILKSDVTELLADRLSGQQLADRSTVLVNGIETKLSLEPTPPPKLLLPPSELY